MKTTSKLALGLACATACLVLGACGEGNVPSRKDVQVKPPATNPTPAPGDKFKGSFGKNESGSGAPAGDAPKKDGDKK